MKKVRFYITFTISFVLVFFYTTHLLHAQDTNYIPLAPIPGVDPAGQTVNFTNYIKGLYALFIGAAAVMAVVMIIVGGIEYMTPDSISKKSSGKNRITSAVLGLLLIIGSFVILNTINPDITNFSIQTDSIMAHHSTSTPAIPPLQLTGGFSANHFKNSPYDVNAVEIKGGTPPYTMQVVGHLPDTADGGTLTATLSGSKITLEGLPSVVGNYIFRIIITDVNNRPISQSETISIVEDTRGTVRAGAPKHPDIVDPRAMFPQAYYIPFYINDSIIGDTEYVYGPYDKNTPSDCKNVLTNHSDSSQNPAVGLNEIRRQVLKKYKTKYPSSSYSLSDVSNAPSLCIQPSPSTGRF